MLLSQSAIIIVDVPCCHSSCLCYCRCILVSSELSVLLSLSSAASQGPSTPTHSPMLPPDWGGCAIVAGQCCYLRVPALLSSFPAATRAACACVAVFRCRLSCHYYCRCHLLPLKVPVPPRTLQSCHLTEMPVLLSLESSATWGACTIVVASAAATWLASYYCRCPLLLPELSVTIVAVLCCYLSCQLLLALSFAATWVASYYWRCPLLLPELLVTIVAVLCCYLSCQLLLSLSFAATWVACYYCRWHLHAALIVDNSQLQMATL